MSASSVGRTCIYRRRWPISSPLHRQQSSSTIARRALQRRTFTSSPPAHRQAPGTGKGEGESFTRRAGKAWRSTKIEWQPIPILLGVAFLGAFQLYRIQRREVADADADAGRVPRRERIRPSGGGWQVAVMSTLPLKAVSRVWGKFNELTIPYYLRVPGFKLYGWIFGVNFDEIKEPDLHVFPNLAAFFYREIKPDARPLDPNPRALLSPADGKVLQFGEISDGEVEQVKGMTYSLDALLGKTPPSRSTSRARLDHQGDAAHTGDTQNTKHADSSHVHEDEEFARINGISYSLPTLFSGPESSKDTRGRKGALPDATDQSTPSKPSSEAAVSADLASVTAPWWNPFQHTPDKPTKLYYLVVYLAPGDYHRFHSPVSWVCNTRRHFAGELYSVSPYVQRTLPGLFTLNERVVLLGQWKYGFFSYTPVGATNVGSIKINFDKELRTNSLTTDTEADRQAMAAKERGEPYSGFSEATYDGASALLQGFPLKRGEEMGGFQLGSSIVMVFEAPAGARTKSLDAGGVEGGATKGGWKWNVERDQKVKIGQALGWVEEDDEST
ncbi:phosphatidylserine decarboxylase 1 [Exophiala xenobiotica]|uniref:Phosphatidylserine decarboxylase proenzyme 1, mitochondrial n=1 Tax=Lithohypha guttulata TaxID=1690604 RepID=A0ABR0K8M9_9EURO|nr:phosphatidylserine decarboxylase 1 [Lithohypha guttulata]KAK5327123.1 phosphatidylserine decarboxylase 1 [Exophiala xenobiotica]